MDVEPLPDPDRPGPAPAGPAAPEGSAARCRSPSEALDLMLRSNFDSDSKACALTLLKVVDNVLAKPGDGRVRTIRLSNPAFDRKVGSRRGGLDFLLCVGFTPRPAPVPVPVPLLAGPMGPKPAEVECIELLEENESRDKLMEARELLAARAANDLGMDSGELPTLRTPPPPPPPPPAEARGGGGTGGGGGGGFDPYRAHSYNAQAAAVGVPNPHSVTPGSDGYVSKTERELESLRAEQARLESKMHRLEDRGIVAARPGRVGPIVSVSAGGGGDGDHFAAAAGGKGDGALIAARMKRMEEDRRRREEGGFTTKAMRDLEKMKKARVYAHATLRINFPDGCSLTAKFLPTETVSDVKSAVSSAFLPHLRPGLGFDLYVSPPRRMLPDDGTLEDEGLVPAAKVHVSWRGGGCPPPPPPGDAAGGYVRPELFAPGGAASSAAAFPDARGVAEDGEAGAHGGKGAAAGAAAGSDGGGGGDREEEMMKRMMGGPRGIMGRLGGKKGGGGGKKDGGGGGGKPKWFKG